MPHSSEDMTDVSVIIPAYNAAATIARALQSVTAQTLKPRQVIVIDDGSGDGTVETARALRSAMHGIDLIVDSQPNRGAGSARNRGIAQASGTWLAFLDADDEWLPDKLAETFSAIEKSSRDPVLVSHDVIVRDGTNETVFDCAGHDVGDVDPFHALYRRGYVSTSTALAKRDAVVRAGGFDTTLANAQDFDLWLALLAVPGTQLLVFPGAFTRHHNQPGSIQTYTGRRLACGMIIAERYIDVLKARPGSTLASLVFRLLAIHAEAVVTHRQNGRWLQAIGVIALLPFRLGAVLLRSLTARPHRRQAHI